MEPSLHELLKERATAISTTRTHAEILGLARYTVFIYFATTLLSLLATAVNQLFYSTYKAIIFQKIYTEKRNKDKKKEKLNSAEKVILHTKAV